MPTQNAAPGEAVAATPWSDEDNNGNVRMVQRPSTPRHIAPILAEILWKLAVAREAERLEHQL